MVIPTQRVTGREKAPLSEEIDSLLKANIGSAGPGGVVTVLKDGNPVVTCTYGMANVEDSTKITANTVFDVASMAKQFTAFATLLLVSDGKISLNTDVHKYIPELPDYGTPVTLNHLIHQTSGLRDYSQLFDLTDNYGDVSVLTQPAVFQMIIRQQHLNFVPGSEFLYSNSNYYLLSVIIARVSGQSFENFMQSRIFRPLGMTHTGFRSDPSIPIPRRAQGYDISGDNKPSLSTSYSDIPGDGNLYTTIGDLAKWDNNFVVAGVGGRETIDKMTTDFVLANGEPAGYGFGLFLGRRYNGLNVIEHDGKERGFVSEILRFPTRGIDVILICNQSNIAVSGLSRKIADLFLATGQTSAAAAASKKGQMVPPSEQELSSYGGVYLNSEGYVRRFYSQGSSLMLSSNGGEATKLTALGNRQFSTGAAIYRFWRPDTSATWKVDRVETGHATRHFELLIASNKVINMDQVAGVYDCPEVGSTWKIALRKDTIVLQRPGAEEEVLTQVFPGGYIGDEGLFRFKQDTASVVTGFAIWSERIRDVDFFRRN
jgi:CubicO group peptidase (beta-lactamase class C family)